MLILYALVFCFLPNCCLSEETNDTAINSSTYDSAAFDLNTSSTPAVSSSGEFPSYNNSSDDYSSEYEDADSGKVAGIVIGIIGALALAGAVVAFCVYKQYVRRNVKSMNFDNPVYRKTTEDQFSLEKNQYQPTRSYPATLEPLTNPGTNEFV